jgi:arginine decarboxylase
MTFHISQEPLSVDTATGTRIIDVSSGVGAAATELAAFDAALREAGVANFNLIHLSSVIPPDSAVVVAAGEPAVPEGKWGDRLYVVMAECRVHARDEEAWAGVGWVQDHSTGRGLFVEHFGNSQHRVDADIEASLTALAAGRPEVSFGSVRSVVRGTVCHGEPVCALVTAVFGSSRWPSTDVIVLT